MTSFQYIIISISISIISLLFFFISYNNYIDTFISEKELNYENDGNMKFEYLLNDNHKNIILNKYYLNDDIKVNSKRLNIHPYQFKNEKYLYGISVFQNKDNQKYGNSYSFSDYIYNTYGVRR